MDWEARWIWAQGDAAPRNFYWCVRKEFDLPQRFRQVRIALSADSRYLLWCNGHYIGQGPVRGFPGDWFYDRYDLTSLVRAGRNVVAVLVHHWGISTFQYLAARGGLIAQVECDGKVVVATDSSWLNVPHPAYERRAVRIACQQAFAEHYEAVREPAQWARLHWTEVGFDDYNWQEAVEIGEAGCPPWGNLHPRPIPLLTQEVVYPRRLLRARTVRPPAQVWAVDLKPNLIPGDLSANPRVLTGLLATLLRTEETLQVRLTGVHHPLPEGQVRLNGRDIAVREGKALLDLQPGENLLMLDVSGWYHDWFYYPVLDYEGKHKVVLTNPLQAEASYPWITIGPFENKEAAEFQKAWSAKRAAELRSLSTAQPIAPEHSGAVNVFALTALATPLSEKPRLEKPEACLGATQESTVLYPPESGDVELLLDFGQEQVGFVELEVKAPAGVTLDFNGFEYLHPMNLDRIQWTTGLNNTFRYVTREGWQVFRSIVRRGFRYATLTVRFPKERAEPVELRSVRCYRNTYPYAERGEFLCSDTRLNAIWEMARYTVRLCSEDTFVDCPAYEQTFWVGDARNEALFAYLAFGDYALARRCWLLAAQSLRRSPLVESQVPSGWENILTAWALLWAIACHEHSLYTGSEDFLREIYPAIATQNRNLHEKFTNSQGLLEIQAWNMLDWAPMDIPSEGVVAHQNMWLVEVWRRTAAMAEQLGHQQDAATWRRWADDLKEAINRHLWDEEKQAYVDCLHKDGTRSSVISQQTQVIAYLCEVVPEAKRALFEKYLVEVPEGWVQIGSPFMMTFLLEALAKAGNYKQILHLIRQGWGLMLDHGATTCWETFPTPIPSSPLEVGTMERWLTRSHCHAWSAAPAYALPTWVLGVQPLEPGFKRFKVEPHLEDLEWARGRVPTPHGEVVVGVQKQQGRLQIDIEIPEGTKASVNGKDYPPGKHTILYPRSIAPPPFV